MRNFSINVEWAMDYIERRLLLDYIVSIFDKTKLV